ncbi:hypothetical protein GQ53DRAFT_63558 [Thozetella sp. PMI_491]|nr:hypothetical protein GQ53DRAFT_63558 [Thozetella sp. PMI_491]
MPSTVLKRSARNLPPLSGSKLPFCTPCRGTLATRPTLPAHTIQKAEGSLRTSVVFAASIFTLPRPCHFSLALHCLPVCVLLVYPARAIPAARSSIGRPAAVKHPWHQDPSSLPSKLERCPGSTAHLQIAHNPLNKPSATAPRQTRRPLPQANGPCISKLRRRLPGFPSRRRPFI